MPGDIPFSGCRKEPQGWNSSQSFDRRSNQISFSTADVSTFYLLTTTHDLQCILTSPAHGIMSSPVLIRPVRDPETLSQRLWAYPIRIPYASFTRWALSLPSSTLFALWKMYYAGAESLFILDEGDPFVWHTKRSPSTQGKRQERTRLLFKYRAFVLKCQLYALDMTNLSWW